MEQHKPSSNQHLCKGKYEVQNICLSDHCNHQMYTCIGIQCPYCSRQHTTCKFVSLQEIYSAIVDNENMHLEYFKDVIFTMQEKMINLIRQSSETSKKLLPTAGISTINKNVLFKLFVKGEFVKTSKSQIRQLVEQYKINNEYLQRQGQNKRKRSEDLAGEAVAMLRKILKIKENYIQNIVRISSKIIQDQHDIEYLYSLINDNPKELQLIFRASQHSFSAKHFHQKCDHIPNTLTILKTSFGNVIAAFAAPKWFSGKQNYSIDKSKQSFIASVTTRKKMVLKQDKYAIFCDENHGPCFGRGFDLKIVDRCNQNENSYFFGPYSYTLDHNIDSLSPKTIWKDFTGRADGYKFRVIDYEVFKIIY